MDYFRFSGEFSEFASLLIWFSIFIYPTSTMLILGYFRNYLPLFILAIRMISFFYFLIAIYVMIESFFHIFPMDNNEIEPAYGHRHPLYFLIGYMEFYGPSVIKIILSISVLAASTAFLTVKNLFDDFNEIEIKDAKNKNLNRDSGIVFMLSGKLFVKIYKTLTQVFGTGLVILGVPLYLIYYGIVITIVFFMLLIATPAGWFLSCLFGMPICDL